MRLNRFWLVTLVLVQGCEAIRTHRALEQPHATTLSTSIGGTIFRLNKTSDLPNILGGQDIWGRQVDEGFKEVKLVGIEGALLTLEITDVEKQSAESVMDKNKPFQNRNSAANANADPKTPIGDERQGVTHVVKLDTQKQKYIVISGILVTFLNIQPHNVNYTLGDIKAEK